MSLCGDKMIEKVLNYPGALDASFDSIIILISVCNDYDTCLYIDTQLTSPKIIKI